MDRRHPQDLHPHFRRQDLQKEGDIPDLLRSEKAQIRGEEIRVPLPSSPSGVQRVMLRIDAQGNAAWSLGETAVLVQPGFPEGPVSLRLFARAESVLPGTPFAEFVFDNVLVTSP